MNIQPNFGKPRPVQVIAAAAVAAVIGLSALWSVDTLFHSRGAPLAQLAAAERACADKADRSERRDCMNQRIAQSRPTRVVAQQQAASSVPGGSPVALP